MRRLLPLLLVLLLASGAADPTSGTPPRATAAASSSPQWEPGQLIVELRSDGPHAVRACAETLTRQGRPFAGATADGSDSLDRLQRRLQVRRVRALFRRPDGTPLAAQRERMRARWAHAARLPGELPDLAHVYLVEIPAALDVGSAVARFREDPHVVYAQPNYRVEAQTLEDGLPDDPFLYSSGSWGQPFEDLWGLLRIRAPEAWPLATGEGVVVAVNDTGLDYDHPDIAANVWINPGEDLNGNGRFDAEDVNGVDDDDNGFVDDVRGMDFNGSSDEDGDGTLDVVDTDPFDDNGHGTHVAGTIAAVADNGIGVLGVAPRARIMALKGLDDSGSGATDALVRGIVYAAENGARVINNSWSCSSRCPSNPVVEDAVRLAHALGVVSVFSAGNHGDDVGLYSPQNMRETVTVAASIPDDSAAFFSNRGFGLDVSAPGAGFPSEPPSVRPNSGILSLLASQASEAFASRVVGGRYLRLAGTSMAAPHVAGLAALLLSQRPALTPDEVRLVLRLSAQDVGEPGFDFRHGAGRIDAVRALELDPVPRVEAEIRTPRPFQTLRLVDRDVEVIGTAAGDDLALHQLFVGAGADPDGWIPLGPPRGDRVRDDVLGVWPLAGFDEGPHVIRLAVTERGGRMVESFAPVGLERNPAQAIGVTPSHDDAPVVSEGLVVWQSLYSESDEPEGWNLLAAEPGDPEGGFRAVVAGPESAQRASLSKGRLVWQGEEWRGWTCRLDADGACDPQALGDARAIQPEVSGDRVVWLDSGLSSGGLSVFWCDVDAASGACDGREIAPSTGGPRFSPTLDGTRLVWSEVSDLFTCLLDPVSRECPPRPLGLDQPTRGPVDEPAIDGNVLAWIEFAPNFARWDLRGCVLDPETGACPIVEIPSSGAPGRPAVGGGVVAWHDTVNGSNTEIFFCEMEPDRCQVQRLTSNLYPQHSPSTDGTWIVWTDRRGGASDIFGFELPQLGPLGEHRVREGEWLVVEVAGRDPLGDPVRLEAALADGTPLESVGAEFVDFGDGRGELRWHPDFDRAGAYTVRVTLTTAGRLHRTGALSLIVEDVNRPPTIRTASRRVAPVGDALTLDACESFDPDGDPLSFRWSDRQGELGDACALELPARRLPGLRKLTLEVGDGQVVRHAPVFALWLPEPAAGAFPP